MNHRKQVVITDVGGIKTLLYMKNENIYDIAADAQNTQALTPGDIYVGRVKNIVKNINAAFVEVREGVLCYLPLSEERDEKPLRVGDDIIIQIKKSAVKEKQAVGTRFPELTGRFCIVTTANSDAGISRKITDPYIREQLTAVLNYFSDEPYGIVLRTAAGSVELDTVREECESLLLLLHEKMAHGAYLSCFSVLHKEAPFYLRYLRECQDGALDRVITDDEQIYRALEEEYAFLKLASPPELTLYTDDSFPLDKMLGITTKMKKALEKRVWLKSGANLVIEPTEALTVIDVNTGKAVDGRRKKETTFFKVNCEAAKEAARQIRMRGISGIIIIDFIDMHDKKNQKDLMDLLQSELKKDPIKTVLMDITRLGLVEITRMKKSPPIWEIYKNGLT